MKVRCLAEHSSRIRKLIEDCEYTFDEIMREETGRSYPLKLEIDVQNPLKTRDIEREVFLPKKRED